MKKKNVIIAAAIASIMLVAGCTQAGSSTTTTTNVQSATMESTATTTETSETTTETSGTTTEESATDTDEVSDNEYESPVFELAGKKFTVFKLNDDFEHVVDGYYTFNEDGSGSIDGADGISSIPTSWSLDGSDLTLSMGSPDDTVVLTLTYDDEGNMYMTDFDAGDVMPMVEGVVDSYEPTYSDSGFETSDDYTPLAPPEESEGEAEYALKNATDAMSAIIQTGRYTCDINMVFEGNGQTSEMPQYAAADPDLGTYLKANVFGITSEGIYKPDGTAILLDAETKTFVNTTTEEAGANVSNDPTASMNITNEPLTKADVVTWNSKKCYRFYVTPEMMTSSSGSDTYIYVDFETGLMCGMYTEQMGTKNTAYITVSGDIDASKFEVPTDYTETTLNSLISNISSRRNTRAYTKYVWHTSSSSLDFVQIK